VTARRGPAAYLRLQVGSRHQVEFVPFPGRPPMFTIGAGDTVVSLTLPEQIEAGHVDFARQLAAKAWAYAVAVERRYRGLPPLPETPVPYTLTARADAQGDAERARELVRPTHMRLCEIQRSVLGVARGEVRRLREVRELALGRRAAVPLLEPRRAAAQVGRDRRAAGGEHPHHLPADARDLEPVTVVPRGPFQAKPGGKGLF
jgi:hypothetical protein